MNGSSARVLDENQDNPADLEAKSEAATQRMRRLIVEGAPVAAGQLYQKASRTLAGWQPPEADLLELIKSLHAEKAWEASIPLMRDCIRRYPSRAARVRLKLAMILVQEQQRPVHALRVLAEIPPGSLPPDLEPHRARLAERANAMLEDGVLELEGED